jgi:cytochrome P450 family 6
MILFCSLLFGIAFAAFLYFRKIFSYWKDLGVLQFPVTFPHGNTKGLGKTICYSQLITEYYQKSKKAGALFCGFYAYFRPILMLTDLDLVRTILVENFADFPNRGFHYNEEDDPLSSHIGNLQNDQWRTLRQKFSPIFSNAKMKMVFGNICVVADRLLELIDKEIVESERCDVGGAIGRFSMDGK